MNSGLFRKKIYEQSKVFNKLYRSNQFSVFEN